MDIRTKKGKRDREIREQKRKRGGAKRGEHEAHTKPTRTHTNAHTSSATRYAKEIHAHNDASDH